ncbi:hypothetical protein F5Y18DRAFT_371799 [Xylariaceae sp. FL1019]|nr:hypothetical protein F5Y18DRAFT_371799 [Xylariaceae sp. FL1019]
MYLHVPKVPEIRHTKAHTPPKSHPLVASHLSNFINRPSTPHLSPASCCQSVPTSKHKYRAATSASDTETSGATIYNITPTTVFPTMATAVVGVDVSDLKRSDLLRTRNWWNDRTQVWDYEGISRFDGDVFGSGQEVCILVYYFFNKDTRVDYFVAIEVDLVDHSGHPNFIEAHCILERLAPSLDPSVRLIILDEKRDVRIQASNPLDHIDWCEYGLNTPADVVPRPRLDATPSLDGVDTICRSQLVEVARLAPIVDLMEDVTRPGSRMIAKWFLTKNDFCKTWQEMHTIKSIPPHPHIVPIHSIIVDDEEEKRILGFSMKQIKGYDLGLNKSTFKMKWLKQLTDTLDYMHLELGICHNDIFPKNIMIDTTTDNLVLVDLEGAIPASNYGFYGDLEVVKWSVYEIITHDEILLGRRYAAEKGWDERWDDLQKRLAAAEERDDDEWGELLLQCDEARKWEYALDSRMIDEMSEWPARASLDCTAQEMRQHLNNWIQRRKATSRDDVLPNNPISLEWQDHAPERSVCTSEKLKHLRSSFLETRRDRGAQEMKASAHPKSKVFWERPAFRDAYPEAARIVLERSGAESPVLNTTTNFDAAVTKPCLLNDVETPDESLVSSDEPDESDDSILSNASNSSNDGSEPATEPEIKTTTETDVIKVQEISGDKPRILYYESEVEMPEGSVKIDDELDGSDELEHMNDFHENLQDIINNATAMGSRGDKKISFWTGIERIENSLKKLAHLKMKTTEKFLKTKRHASSDCVKSLDKRQSPSLEVEGPSPSRENEDHSQKKVRFS